MAISALGSALKVLLLCFTRRRGRRTSSQPWANPLTSVRRHRHILLFFPRWLVPFIYLNLVDQQCSSIAFLSSIVVTVFPSLPYTRSPSLCLSLALHCGWSGHCAATLRIARHPFTTGFPPLRVIRPITITGWEDSRSMIGTAH